MHEVSRGGVIPAGVQMDGDTLEQWLSGTDIRTGQPKGVIRHDEHALRAVEVVVNQSRDLDIAAMLHPDVKAALHAAQDSAVAKVLRCAASVAVTRAGPRGAVQMVPVSSIETYTCGAAGSATGREDSRRTAGVGSDGDRHDQ